MQINRRVTNGLAWAGLFIVVGVPAADMVSAQLMGDTETISVVSDMGAVAPVPAPLSQRPTAPVAQKPVIQTAAAQPVKPVEAPVVKPVASTATAVDSFLATGKKLPSYITGGDASAAVAVTPQAVQPAKPVVVSAAPTQSAQSVAPVQAQPVLTDPVEVASVTPQKIAPIPMPLSMRPRAIAQQRPTQPAAEEIVIPQRDVAEYDAPVTERDLEGWETGPLSDYLAQQEARNPRDRADAAYDREPEYDDDGFYLSDGPNRRSRGTRYIRPVQEEFYFPFVN